MTPGFPIYGQPVLNADGSRTGRASTEEQHLGKAGKRTCDRCKAGDHSKKHTRIGCLAIVGRVPSDFVCQCPMSDAGGIVVFRADDEALV